MQIQKGLVKYKDRSDIICTYGITDDGKQYYFLDGNRLPNGNIIATTALVEAIDPVAVSSSIGVIDVNGNVVIPFENKAIKLITDNILLVEKSKPTTDSVLEAIKLRSDPLAATRLVTTPATIKDKINGKMGTEGKFVFNDQFSEASIFDVDGKNLINNEYFSFIGVNKEKVFFSKNTVDSDVREYAFNVSSVENNILDGNMDAVKLNIENTGVSKETIEDAINSQVAEKNDDGIKESKPIDDESANNNEDDSDNIKIDNESVVDDAINMDVKDNDISEDVDTNKDEQVVDNSSVESGDVEEEVATSQELKDVSGDLTLNIAQELEDSIDGESEMNNSDINFDISSNDVDSSDFSDTELDLFNNVGSDSINNEDDVSFDSILKEDSMFSDTNYIDDYKDDYSSISSNPVKDTIIEDVAVTMSNLIKLNRNQKRKLENYEMNINQLKATNKKIVQGAKSQAREIESLKSRVKNYETIVAKLEARNQILDSKVHEQERVITIQNEELNTLRPQVEGKKDLVRLLEDAQSLFNSSDKNDSYDKGIVA